MGFRVYCLKRAPRAPRDRQNVIPIKLKTQPVQIKTVGAQKFQFANADNDKFTLKLYTPSCPRAGAKKEGEARNPRTVFRIRASQVLQENDCERSFEEITNRDCRQRQFPAPE